MPTPDEPDAETSKPVEQAGLAMELDERLTELDGLSARPLHEHVEVYQRMHVGLQAALAEIDSA